MSARRRPARVITVDQLRRIIARYWRTATVPYAIREQVRQLVLDSHLAPHEEFQQIADRFTRLRTSARATRWPGLPAPRRLTIDPAS